MACGPGLLGCHVVICVAIAMVARASFPVRLVRCVTLVDEVSGEAKYAKTARFGVLRNGYLLRYSYTAAFALPLQYPYT